MAQQPPAPPPPPPPPPTGPYAGAPGYAARPGGVTAAAVLLFAVGGLRGLLMLLSLIVVIGASGDISGLPGAGAAIGIAVVVVLIGLLAAVLQIVGGVGTMQLRRRGRTLGLTGSIIGIALGVLALLGAASGGATAVSVVIALLFLFGDIAIIVTLSQNGRFLTNP
ncbi:MAG: hypothetical protein ACRDKA_11525 [Actinomycetota bacterium]